MQVTGNKTSQSYSLSIRLRTDGFSFYLNNPSQLSFIQKEDYAVAPGATYADVLQQALQTSPLTRKVPATVYVQVCTPATRVPLDYFRKDEAEALHRLTFPHTDIRKNTIFYNILPQLEMVEISSIEKDVEQVLQTYCTTQLHLTGMNSNLLEAMKTYEEQRHGTARRLYTCLREQEMLIFCIHDHKLLFANSYEIAAAPNAVYYLLYVWKLLSLNPQADECVLIGYHQNNPMQNTLKAYLRNVSTLMPTDVFPHLPQTGGVDIPFDVLTLLSSKN